VVHEQQIWLQAALKDSPAYYLVGITLALLEAYTHDTQYTQAGRLKKLSKSSIFKFWRRCRGPVRSVREAFATASAVS